MPMLDFEPQHASTARSRFVPFGPSWAVLCSLALLALLPAWPALAQEESPSSLESVRERVDELVRQLEESYDLSREGSIYLLEPENARDDFVHVEVGAGEISIDGVEVGPEELRRFVDSDSEAILELAQALAEGERFSVEAEDSADREWEVEESDRDRRSERSHRRSSRTRRHDTQVSFGTGLTVEAGESVREVVLIGGPLEVFGLVDGEATVILGSATVSGTVDGSLTVVGGSAHLMSGSVIEGDVVVVGGRLTQDDDSRIDGEVVQVAVGEAIDTGDVRVDFGDLDFGWGDMDPFDFAGWELAVRVFKTGLVAIVLAFLTLMAPGRVARISERARVEPWKSGLVGLVIEVLFFPLLGLVSILLLVSIVGIPLLVIVPPLLIFLLVLFFFLGFAGIALSLGRLLGERFGLAGSAAPLLVLLGLFLVDIWSFIGELSSLLPWPLRLFAVMLLVGGFLFKYLVWTAGLGAAVLEQLSPLPPAAYDPAPIGPGPIPGQPSYDERAWESESEPLATEAARHDPIESAALGPASEPPQDGGTPPRDP